MFKDGMRKNMKKKPEEDWERLKPLIIDKYKPRAASVKVVRRWLKEEHGFIVS